MMFSILALVLSAFGATQDESVGQAPRLIERLGSNRIEERVEAEHKLRALGKSALPQLERAAKGPDAEVASRAQHLLRLISVQDRLTNHLIQVLPGIEERLSLKDEHSWTALFLEAAKAESRHSIEANGHIFEPGDFEGVAPLALRGAISIEEKINCCAAIEQFGTPSAAKEVVKLLNDSHVEVRRRAVETLAGLGAPEATSGIARALRDTDPDIQGRACEALVSLSQKNAAPEMARLLRSDSTYLRGVAARSLARLGAVDHTKEIVALLNDPNSNVRFYAVQAVADLGATESAPRIRELLRDEDPDVRAHAIRALESLDGKNSVDPLRVLLSDPIPLVKMAAAGALCRLGVREAVPHLLELRDKPYAYGSLNDLRLDWLNCIRQPEAWARVRERYLKKPIAGTVDELRARIEKEAGLKIEWPPVFSLDPRIENRGDRLWVIDAARYLATSDLQGPEIIIEADRIRFLPEKEGLKFWREWWGEEQRKKK